MKDGKKVAIGAGVVLGIGVLAYLATRVEAVPPPPPGKANLYGKVTDSITGNPLGGALVTLDGLSVYTNSGGNYSFLDIATGEYSGSVSKEGYEAAYF